MDGVDLRLFQMRDGMLELRTRAIRPTCSLELFAQSQLELAGRFLRKCDGQNLIDPGGAGRQNIDHPRDQLGGLASSRRRLDEQAFVERGSDLLPRVLVNKHAVPYGIARSASPGPPASFGPFGARGSPPRDRRPG